MEAFTAGGTSTSPTSVPTRVTGWCAGAEWLVPITRRGPLQLRPVDRAQRQQHAGGALPRQGAAAGRDRGDGPIRDERRRTGGPLATPVSARSPRRSAPASRPSRRHRRWPATAGPSAPSAPPTAAACSSPTPTSRGRASCASGSRTSPCPASSTSTGPSCRALPGIGIGFTEDVRRGPTPCRPATASPPTRSTSCPGKPTTYRYDGGEKADDLARGDGRGAPGRRHHRRRRPARCGSASTARSSTSPVSAGPTAMTVTYRDANIDNDEFIEQYLAMDQAHELRRVQGGPRHLPGRAAVQHHRGEPRTARRGTPTPRPRPTSAPRRLAAYEAALGRPVMAAIAADSGAVLLDGSDSIYQWVESRRRPRPRAWSPSTRCRRPSAHDYVFNANDSFWLANADRAARGRLLAAPRPRRRPPGRRAPGENATVLADTTATGAIRRRRHVLPRRGARPRRWPTGDTPRRVARATRWSRVARARPSVDVPELLGVRRHRGAARRVGRHQPRPARCSTLGRLVRPRQRRAPSCGASSSAGTDRDRSLDAGALWAEPFDAADPVGTPSGLAPAPDGGVDPVLVNLAGRCRSSPRPASPSTRRCGDVQLADRNGTACRSTAATASTVSPTSSASAARSVRPSRSRSGGATGRAAVGAHGRRLPDQQRHQLPDGAVRSPRPGPEAYACPHLRQHRRPLLTAVLVRRPSGSRTRTGAQIALHRRGRRRRTGAPERPSRGGRSGL